MSGTPVAPHAARSGRLRATISQLAHRFPRPGSDRTDAWDEQRFWMCFELELERARRYERQFAMSRLTVPATAGVDVHRALDDAAPSVRATDAITVVGDRILALWSEADREAAAIAVDRLLARLPTGAVGDVETMVFPDDGLSATAFVERLTQGRSQVERANGRRP